MKPFFILYDDDGQRKLHKKMLITMGKIILILISPKSLKIGLKTPKIWENM